MGYSAFSEDAAFAGITWRRGAGWAVDALLQGLILGALHLVLWLAGFITFGLGWFLANGLWVVPIAYVFTFVVSPAQATPGQALLGLRVVRDDDLGRPTPAQALVYAVVFALTWAAGAIWLIAAFFTRRSRCLHDMVAGLAVMRQMAVPEDETALQAGWAVR